MGTCSLYQLYLISFQVMPSFLGSVTTLTRAKGAVVGTANLAFRTRRFEIERSNLKASILTTKHPVLEESSKTLSQATVNKIYVSFYIFFEKVI